MMTLERRHDLITVVKPHFLPKRRRSTRSYFMKAIDYSFYGLRAWRDNPLGMLGDRSKSL